jgi:hypothetical protein
MTLVDCPEVLLNLFPGERTYPAPPFSVLMIDGDIPLDGDVVLDASRLKVVTVGEPGFALLVGRNSAPLSAANLDEPSLLHVTPHVRTELKLAAPTIAAAGDLEFLAEADAKLKNERLRSDLRCLVEQVRAMSPRGTLRSYTAGLTHNRSYVNAPDNFVGFAIRRQAVVVRARRTAAARQSKFKISQERRPFIRFQLRSSEDVEAALPLIQASWRRGV